MTKEEFEDYSWVNVKFAVIRVDVETDEEKSMGSIDLITNITDYNLLDAAFENYQVRLEEEEIPNLKGFCDYINSKRLRGLSDHYALSPEEYSELLIKFEGD